MLKEEFQKEFSNQNDTNSLAKEESTIKILILQRGWITVGNVKKENGYFISENSSVIRKWGTTKGIGELAFNGPTEETKLDKCGTVRAHELTTVAIIDCNSEKWENVLESKN